MLPDFAASDPSLGAADTIPPTLTVSFTIGMIISGTNANGTPALAPVSSTDTEPGCLLLVNPNSYSVPVSGYSILALTHLLSYASGNPNSTAVAELLSMPYNLTVRSKATGVSPSHGYARLNPGYDPTSTIMGCVSRDDS